MARWRCVVRVPRGSWRWWCSWLCRAARHATARFASRFVKPGEPTATYDDPNAAPQTPTSVGVRAEASRAAVEGRTEEQPAADDRIEQSRAGEALLLLAMHESAGEPSAGGSGLSEGRCARLRLPALSARRRSRALRRRLLRRHGEALARLGHAGSRAERGPPRAELQQEVGGDLQHARHHSRVARAAGGRRAGLSKRRGAQPARHVRAEQSVLPRDDAGRRGRRRALLRGGARRSIPNFAPARNNLALVEAKRGDLAARSSGFATASAERRLALQRRRPASQREALSQRRRSRSTRRRRHNLR